MLVRSRRWGLHHSGCGSRCHREAHPLAKLPFAAALKRAQTMTPAYPYFHCVQWLAQVHCTKQRYLDLEPYEKGVCFVCAYLDSILHIELHRQVGLCSEVLSSAAEAGSPDTRAPSSLNYNHVFSAVRKPELDEVCCVGLASTMCCDCRRACPARVRSTFCQLSWRRGWVASSPRCSPLTLSRLTSRGGWSRQNSFQWH